MKDVLSLETGARPWSPSDDVSPGEVLDEYDVPTTGLLTGSGKTYLFTNILGDSAATGLWAYTVVTDDEIMRLLSAAEPDGFDAAVEAALRNKRVTVAAAVKHGLSHWSTFDSGSEGSLGLSQRFRQRLEHQLKEGREAARDLEHEATLASAGQ